MARIAAHPIGDASQLRVSHRPGTDTTIGSQRCMPSRPPDARSRAPTRARTCRSRASPARALARDSERRQVHRRPSGPCLCSYVHSDDRAARPDRGGRVYGHRFWTAACFTLERRSGNWGRPRGCSSCHRYEWSPRGPSVPATHELAFNGSWSRSQPQALAPHALPASC